MDFQPSSETLQNSLSCCLLGIERLTSHLSPQRTVSNDLFLQTASSTVNLLALYPVIKAPTQPSQFVKNIDKLITLGNRETTRLVFVHVVFERMRSSTWKLWYFLAAKIILWCIFIHIFEFNTFVLPRPTTSIIKKKRHACRWRWCPGEFHRVIRVLCGHEGVNRIWPYHGTFSNQQPSTGYFLSCFFEDVLFFLVRDFGAWSFLLEKLKGGCFLFPWSLKMCDL